MAIGGRRMHGVAGAARTELPGGPRFPPREILVLLAEDAGGGLQVLTQRNEVVLSVGIIADDGGDIFLQAHRLTAVRVGRGCVQVSSLRRPGAVGPAAPRALGACGTPGDAAGAAGCRLRGDMAANHVALNEFGRGRESPSPSFSRHYP